MKVLVTGSSGYIGARLIQVLAEKGHHVLAVARVPETLFIPEKIKSQVTFIKGDLTQPIQFPEEIDAAYYLIHSMSNKEEDFEKRDKRAAEHFVDAINKTNCKQIVYLTGLICSENLSKHLRSRLEVERILESSNSATTVLRAGIIIGSGSASFEIIRDLTEKLPIMIAPKWILNCCQPISIRDVMFYLSEVLSHQECIGKTFDIGGPDILTYKEMLLGYAKCRKLHRFIGTVPFFSPKLSSYWLFFITSTNFYLAKSLVDSMKVNAVCTEYEIQKIFKRKCLNYQEALSNALSDIEENTVVSSWRDSWSSTGSDPKYYDYLKIPDHGCYTYTVIYEFKGDPDELFDRLCKIGGKNGYYFMDWAWRLRGVMDRFIGGVGLRRGKTQKENIQAGDSIDVWRVLQVDKEHHILKLFGEMKLPGDGWLEFKIAGNKIDQTATYRPRGLFGRLYWWLCYPLHIVLFPGMLTKILGDRKVKNK